jgi:hypothetical protein
MHRNIVSFVKGAMDPTRGANDKDFTGLVSWYYLNYKDRKPVREFASEDELVFRVPLSWLKENVLACLDYPLLTINEVSRPHDTWHRPYVFLTALVVPLEYRIVDKSPIENEDVVSQAEIRDLIFMSHMNAEKSLRWEQEPPFA